jgi:hypothetical protein
MISPVIAVRPLQIGKAGGIERPIGAGGKLLDAREQRAASHQLRRRLDQRHLGIGIHQPDQTAQRVAGHQAVGVQDHHIVVKLAPILAEVLDVTRLAARVAGPVAVIDVGVRAQLLG